MAEQKEQITDGLEVVRDDSGKFRSVSLSSERAALLGSRSHGGGGSKQDLVDELLKDRGVDPASADSGLRALASIALSGRSGSVAALKYLDYLSAWGKPQAETVALAHEVHLFGDPPQIAYIDNVLWLRPSRELEDRIGKMLLDRLNNRESESDKITVNPR